MDSSRSDPLNGVRPVFRAVVETVVPEAVRLDGDGWTELEEIVRGALDSRPRHLVRQLRLLLRVIDLRARMTGHGFVALGAGDRARILSWFEASRALLLRRGFWGLRTLALMGYYARPAAAREIGYRAHAGGWAARGEGR
jgi:hypothetical protein